MAQTRVEEEPPAGPAHVLRPTERVGRYQLRGLLGHGSTSRVYLARDPDLDRPVAVKVLDAGAGEDARARLFREARVLARVRHANVVSVLDVGLHRLQHAGACMYVVLELCAGGDLRSWLRARRREVDEVLEAFVQAGRGLAAVHASGYVHRDFKPANVVRDRGRVCVADFGLAKLASEPAPGPDAPLAELLGSGTGTLTGTGLVMGTPAYMSPEQFQAHEVDARSDQYAFCVALFEALYGRRPFAGRTRLELAVNMACGEMWQPPANSPVSQELLAVVQRGLAPDPSLRFPSMDELLAHLDRVSAMSGMFQALGTARFAHVSVSACVSGSGPHSSDSARP